MQANVGSLDRTLRFIAGAAIIAAGIYYQSWWGAVGLVPILTATLRWCPAYIPFGVSSCKTDSRKSDH